jgi:hypothetical protein
VNQLLVEINPPSFTWSVCADKLCLPTGSIGNWHWTDVADDQDVDAQFVDEGLMAKPVVGVPSLLAKFRPEMVTMEPPLEAMFGGAVDVSDGCGTQRFSSGADAQTNFHHQHCGCTVCETLVLGCVSIRTTASATMRGSTTQTGTATQDASDRSEQQSDLIQNV